MLPGNIMHIYSHILPASLNVTVNVFTHNEAISIVVLFYSLCPPPAVSIRKIPKNVSGPLFFFYYHKVSKTFEALYSVLCWFRSHSASPHPNRLRGGTQPFVAITPDLDLTETTSAPPPPPPRPPLKSQRCGDFSGPPLRAQTQPLAAVCLPPLCFGPHSPPFPCVSISRFTQTRTRAFHIHPNKTAPPW